jgi:hypothetical protein
MVAIDEVLKNCKSRVETRVILGTVVEASEPRVEQAAYGQKASDAFETELTKEERDKFMNRYSEKTFTWGYTPSTPLLKKLAAFEWHQMRTSKTVDIEALIV